MKKIFTAFFTCFFSVIFAGQEHCKCFLSEEKIELLFCLLDKSIPAVSSDKDFLEKSFIKCISEHRKKIIFKKHRYFHYLDAAYQDHVWSGLHALLYPQAQKMVSLDALSNFSSDDFLPVLRAQKIWTLLFCFSYLAEEDFFIDKDLLKSEKPLFKKPLSEKIYNFLKKQLVAEDINLSLLDESVIDKSLDVPFKLLLLFLKNILLGDSILSPALNEEVFKCLRYGLFSYFRKKYFMQAMNSNEILNLVCVLDVLSFVKAADFFNRKNMDIADNFCALAEIKLEEENPHFLRFQRNREKRKLFSRDYLLFLVKKNEIIDFKKKTIYRNALDFEVLLKIFFSLKNNFFAKNNPLIANFLKFLLKKFASFYNPSHGGVHFAKEIDAIIEASMALLSQDSFPFEDFIDFLQVFYDAPEFRENIYSSSDFLFPLTKKSFLNLPDPHFFKNQGDIKTIKYISNIFYLLGAGSYHLCFLKEIFSEKKLLTNNDARFLAFYYSILGYLYLDMGNFCKYRELNFLTIHKLQEGYSVCTTSMLYYAGGLFFDSYKQNKIIEASSKDIKNNKHNIDTLHLAANSFMASVKACDEYADIFFWIKEESSQEKDKILNMFFDGVVSILDVEQEDLNESLLNFFEQMADYFLQQQQNASAYYKAGCIFERLALKLYKKLNISIFSEDNFSGLDSRRLNSCKLKSQEAFMCASFFDPDNVEYQDKVDNSVIKMLDI